jgi:hypothetical protein
MELATGGLAPGEAEGGVSATPRPVRVARDLGSAIDAAARAAYRRRAEELAATVAAAKAAGDALCANRYWISSPHPVQKAAGPAKREQRHDEAADHQAKRYKRNHEPVGLVLRQLHERFGLHAHDVSFHTARAAFIVEASGDVPNDNDWHARASF